MVIAETVRVYESQSAVNRALGQFKRHRYQAALGVQVRDQVYVVKAVKHSYPFLNAIIRKLNKLERQVAA